MATEAVRNNRGTYDFVKLTSGSIPYLDRVALGQVPGVTSLFKFGSYANVGTVETIIQDLDGQTYPFTKLGETFPLAFNSTSPDDAVGGSGARLIAVEYLDVNGIQQIGTFPTNGTNTVDCGIDANFVYRAYVLRGGESQNSIRNNNVGDIVFFNRDAATDKHSQISEGVGQTEMATFRVPSNKKLLLINGSFQVASGKECTLFLKFRPNELGLPGGEYNPFRVFFRNEKSANGSSDYPELSTPKLIPPNSDLIITGQMASTTGRVSASFGGRLYDI